MIALGLLVIAIASAAPEDNCFAADDDGTTFPTCFDPGQGLELGVGAGSRFVDGPGAGTALELRAGILFRSERESRSRRGSLWLVEHRLLTVRGQPAERLREVSGTLFEGTYRRHLMEGFILVPTSEPVRLPFPFDVALHVRAGTWERRVFDGPGYKLEVGRLALMLDPVRSVSGRFHAAFGPAFSYTVRHDGETLEHELSPFTSALVDLGAESADGWWNTRLVALAGWASVPGEESFFRASGQLQLERLVFAFNDQPIWLYLSGLAAYRDAGQDRATELVGSAGLVMRAFQ